MQEFALVILQALGQSSGSLLSLIRAWGQGLGLGLEVGIVGSVAYIQAQC